MFECACAKKSYCSDAIFEEECHASCYMESPRLAEFKRIGVGSYIRGTGHRTPLDQAGQHPAPDRREAAGQQRLDAAKTNGQHACGVLGG